MRRPEIFSPISKADRLRLNTLSGDAYWAEWMRLNDPQNMTILPRLYWELRQRYIQLGLWLGILVARS
jgi:hypothetical protein